MSKIKITNLGLNIAEDNVSIEVKNADKSFDVLGDDKSLLVTAPSIIGVFLMSVAIGMWGSCMFGAPCILGAASAIPTVGHHALYVIRTN